MVRQLKEAPMHQLRWILTIAVLFTPVAAFSQDEVVYYHTDAVGSVRMVTDATGAVVARYDYLPFGELWPTSPANSNPDARQFTGAERDPETGLDYLGARYLRAQSGLFLTPDPGHVGGDIFDPQSWNAYSYALNNPLRFVDPFGTEPCQIALDAEAAAASGMREGAIVEGECVRGKRLETWSERLARNVFGFIPFTATLQAPGIGEANLALPDRSPDTAVLIAAAVIRPGQIAAKATTLAKTMQSEAGVAQLLAGGGKVMAGAGHKNPIKNIERLLLQHGGKASEWVKISSTTPGLETHAYKNIITGVVVELKSIPPKY